VPDLNHLIVWCEDKQVGAKHLLEIITRPYGAETEASGG
jgi:hypothetical protein